jgi:predicted O-methyltransferase YrrM
MIEAKRKALLRTPGVLVDGSLGDGGRFDGGTVRRAAQASSKLRQCRALYQLTRFLTPLTVLELGTNCGIGSAYLSGALAKNRAGRLVSMDMSPYRLRIAAEIHRQLGLKNIAYVRGTFADTLPQALREMVQVDMAFIDGHHDYEPTLAYFRQIMPHTSDGALLVFDDIHWTPGMEKAWAEIQADPRVELAVDLTAMGLCVVRQEPVQTRYRVPRIRGMFV